MWDISVQPWEDIIRSKEKTGEWPGRLLHGGGPGTLANVCKVGHYLRRKGNTMWIKEKPYCRRTGYEVHRSHTAGTVKREIQDGTQEEPPASSKCIQISCSIAEDVSLIGRLTPKLWCSGALSFNKDIERGVYWQTPRILAFKRMSLMNDHFGANLQ